MDGIMLKKLKFKPKITRVKLNPEQAVLACTCWNVGNNWEYVVGGPLNPYAPVITSTPCSGRQANYLLGVREPGVVALVPNLASS